MQTVILAAGEGTRMRPLTDAISKPLLPVADRPLVGHIASDAVAAGASRLVVVAGDNREALESTFGESIEGTPVEYVTQSEQVGTADALAAARSALEAAPFAVLNGDVLFDRAGLSDLYEGPVPSIAAAEVADPTAYGVLERDRSGAVTGVIEKPTDPPGSLVNAGGYTFPAGALDGLETIDRSARGEYELTDLVTKVCEGEPMRPVRMARWIDVGRPWELLEATEWRLENLTTRVAGTVSDDAHLKGPIVMEDGAEIEAGVTIQGPVLIRTGAHVGPNAFVRPASVIGPEARVGHAVEVKNSVLLSGATVGHQSYVGDSILGPDANLGAGTNVANLRHDGEPVRTTVKGERVSTGRRKYGAVVGPRAKTGINTSLNAGMVLPTAAMTMPGAAVLSDSDYSSPASDS